MCQESANKILDYFHERGKGTEIYLGNMPQICTELNMDPVDIGNAMTFLYEVCEPQISFNLLTTRDDKMNVIGCKYNIHTAKEIEEVMDELKITNYLQHSYDEVEFLMNQFTDKVPKFMFYEICKLYFKIKSVNPKKFETARHIYITNHYLIANKIDPKIIDAILTAGYATKVDEDDVVIKWKIFNDNEFIADKQEEEKPQTSEELTELKTNINNVAVSVKSLMDNMLSQIGVEPQESLDQKALLKDLDDLFNEYESMEDWEKIKNSDAFINTWKEIRKEYFNDRD